MNLRQLWRIITRQETPMEKAKRAIRGARADSQWMAKPPLSDSDRGYNSRNNRGDT